MKLILIILFTSLTYSQESIVASGDHNQTIGEVFPIMQQVQKVEEVTLGVPKFEIPIEPKKEVKKKKSFIQSIVEFFRKLINKQK